MKKTILLLLMILSTYGAFAQNFAVIDENYANVEQARNRYFSQQTCMVKHVQNLASNQISNAMDGRMVSNLHLYVTTEPGSIVFCNMTLTSENLKDYALNLLQMASCVSDKIIVHSTNVFTTEQGIDFKNKLEQLTGLSVTSI
jgi:hypothetical protein